MTVSQLLPSQARRAVDGWAASTIGCRTIFAPSKAHPPAAAPGVNG